MHARAAGWTLIELVVALLIVAVLASLAVPGYRNHALRAHRTEAKSALLDLAAAQERFYLHHDRYAGSFTASAVASGDQAADERCATFTIDAFGTKGAMSAAGIAAEGCWE